MSTTATFEEAFQSPPPPATGDNRFERLTQRVSEIVERKSPRGFWLLLVGGLSLVLLLAGSLADLVGMGIGEWGNDQSVAWAWDITGFVFWIGIGHAGTFISAILLLCRQKWRTTINRAAEAMTLFAVATAAVYPVFHLGRVWLGYWLVPIPNQMNLWPNFQSPLTWDVFAIGTYATVSLLFFYVGLLPDLATLRDRATTRTRQIVFGILALGWQGSSRHFRHHEAAYLVLAGLSTPLVLSVHTIVSFDFAVSIVPGWHTTIFPPYFVAGAVFSGFAMVVMLMVIVRKALHIEDLVTVDHLEKMNKILLATGTMIGYAYGVELFMAWYGHGPYEAFAQQNRAAGPYAWAYRAMVVLNVGVPQLFWIKRVRRSIPAMFAISLLAVVGMWLERFVIVVTSLHRDYLPSSWTHFTPRLCDVTTFAGTVGLFATMFLLFVRLCPAVAISEVKAALPFADGHRAPGTPPPLPVSAEDAWAEQIDTASHVGFHSLIHGLCKPAAVLGWFPHAAAVKTACRKLRDEGFRDVDAHTPFPVHAVERDLGLRRSKVPWIALACGAGGAALGATLQRWIQVVAYPQNIGGKPPSFWAIDMPVTFELAILFAALGCFVGLFVLSGLPRPYDPIMRHPSFDRASTDCFFVSIRATDPQFSLGLEALIDVGARDVVEVAS